MYYLTHGITQRVAEVGILSSVRQHGPASVHEHVQYNSNVVTTKLGQS